MDPLLAITANTPALTLGANGAATLTGGMLASNLSFLTAGSFGGASTVVELSGLSQVLSAAATFQGQLGALQPGTATSGGGQNFGTDIASLAAEVQSFVDAFNNLQNNIVNADATGSLLGAGVPGASGLAQALDAQAQASYTNANSSLTSLAQLGIVFQPSKNPDGGGILSIDLAALQSAFNTDAAGAFSLLSNAASAFADLGGSFVSQAGTQFSALAALGQTSSAYQFLTNSILSPTPSSSSFNLAGLLAIESLTQGSLGGANAQSTILALSQYALISTLLG